MANESYFAGLPACTDAEEVKKYIVLLLSLGLFVALSVGMFLAYDKISKSKLKFQHKTIMYALILLLVLPVCIGVPIVVNLMISPWCA